MSIVQRRVFNRLLGVSCALLIGALSGSSLARNQDAQARVWSRNVWSAALDAEAADLNLLRTRFDDMPSDAFDGAYLDHFKLYDARNRENERNALLERDEEKVKAMEEMREHLAAGDLSESLLAAVKVQTLSNDYDDAFENPDIREIIDWAKREIPRLEADNDWLEVQELVYRLRTLFEDTSRIEEYAQYDKDLTDVNRRVTLLAKYAPRHLHAYRTSRAERLGEDPPPAFNEFKSDDWMERLQGITVRMLKTALKTAAVEHIEDEKWRPLLQGGLEALRIFATTPALDETFKTLDDADRVDRWVAFLDGELRDLKGVDDDELTSWSLSRMIDRILTANQDTVNLPKELIYREFGDGAMFNLDKFSEIMWPDKLRRFMQSTQGNFIGVGIIIRETETNDIMVVNPLEGAPAYFSGVKPNDLIVEVDGESTVGWSTNDAADRIQGEPNTQVTLGLKRENVEDIIPITITRQEIKLPSVFGWWKEKLTDEGDPVWNWYIDDMTKIAYIRLTMFTEDSYGDLLAAWRDIEKAGGANGLILDLRYNPGGLLLSAVQISNLFLEGGVIVTGEDKFEREAFSQRASRQRAKLAGLPTVILVNKGSASASEIVAGCLQAHGAAVILGERSYGKGSVQTVHRIADNANLKLTTQYYRLPPITRKGETKGRIVHKRPRSTMWGVEPDIKVAMTPTQIEKSYFLRQEADIIPESMVNGKQDEQTKERPSIDELITGGLDPQLESALLLLQARVLADMDTTTKHASSR